MRNFVGELVLSLISISLFQGFMVQSVEYDHSASIECLPDPMKPLYGGGIIQNGDFDSGLMGWSTHRSDAKAGVRSSPSGNKFAVAQGGGAGANSSSLSGAGGTPPPSRSVYQKVHMKGDTHYSLSAWLQVSPAGATVRAVVKAAGGGGGGEKNVTAGVIEAQAWCWSMLKGGMTSDSLAGPREIFFESDAPVDIWVDSVSLQPFSPEEWDAHTRRSADRARRSTVKIAVVVPGSGEQQQEEEAAPRPLPLPHANVSIKLVRAGFPFGNAMTKEILDLPAYERWFTSRFTVATMENEMKWYSTEWSQNQEDYRIPDRMLQLASKHGIRVRGHNVFWDDQNSQIRWVRPMSLPQLKAAMQKRLKSVVSRYAGKVIHWDVVNENLHFSFFEQKLGPTASAAIYQQVGQLDRAAVLFMNEFNTLEQPMDPNPTPSKYIAKMKQIRGYAGNGGLKLGVGLESHFSTPNLPYMRAALDTLAQLKLPMWMTEVDVVKGPNQVKHLEQVLREGYGHAGVGGIVMWAAWHAHGCYVMCLTDNSFNNLPVGALVDKLIAEWKTHKTAAATDAAGVLELDLPHGEYSFTVTHPSLDAPAVHTLTVDAAAEHTITVVNKA